MKRIAPVKMWAVVLIQPRSTWINWFTISRTRAGAAKTYLENWLPAYREERARERNKTWRTIRVSVHAEGGS